MKYEKLVKLDDFTQVDLSVEDKITRRAFDIQQLIDDFILGYEERELILVQPIENASRKLATLYFSICQEYIKPVIKEKINKYKMASLMKLLIVKEQILIHPKEEDGGILTRTLNAELGMTASFSLINCMISEATKDFYFDTINASINHQVQKILEDHKLWLITKNLNEIPIFINAQFHELIEVLLGAPYQIHG